MFLLSLLVRPLVFHPCFRPLKLTFTCMCFYFHFSPIHSSIIHMLILWNSSLRMRIYFLYWFSQPTPIHFIYLWNSSLPICVFIFTTDAPTRVSFIFSSSATLIKRQRIPVQVCRGNEVRLPGPWTIAKFSNVYKSNWWQAFNFPPCREPGTVSVTMDEFLIGRAWTNEWVMQFTLNTPRPFHSLWATPFFCFLHLSYWRLFSYLGISNSLLQVFSFTWAAMRYTTQSYILCTCILCTMCRIARHFSAQ